MAQQEPPHSAGATVSADPPWLSVIIPVWNREDTIRRCLDSVLAQDFDAFEVLAVDDASSDRSVAIMRSYDDRRLTAICRDANGGPCAARAVGLAHARGCWIVYLDSDDEMKPGALQTLAAMSRSAGPDVGVVGMSYEYEDGSKCPDPDFPEGDVGFEQWLAWRTRARRTDFLACHRRDIYNDIPMPTDGREGAQMTLRVASRWRTRVSPAIGGKVYTSGRNRHSDRIDALPVAAKLAHAVMNEQILAEFGPALRSTAPAAHAETLYKIGYWYLLAGRRARGAAYVMRYLRKRPISWRGWGCLLTGLVSPTAWARLRLRLAGRR
jgi:glycosyltransferase involved in cell wall biosynthesis